MFRDLAVEAEVEVESREYEHRITRPTTSSHFLFDIVLGWGWMTEMDVLVVGEYLGLGQVKAL
jgi:hypothetical protein